MNKQYRKLANQRRMRVFMKQPALPVNGKRPLESLREIIGLVTAGAGIFAVLLYLAGRNFAVGYFGAMNIPNYQVSFTLWEYGEVAWRPMIIYTAVMFALASLVWVMLLSVINWVLLPIINWVVLPIINWVVLPIINWIVVSIANWVIELSFIKFIIKHILGWLKKFKKPSISLPAPNQLLRESLVTFLLVALLIFLLFFVDYTLYFVRGWGEITGRLNVLQNSAQIDIVSATSLNLDNEVVNDKDQYLYKNYQLLTFNEDKYYVFKDIDPVTCKPNKVSVVDSKNLLQVNLATTRSLESKCSKEIPKDISSIIKYLFSK